MVSIDIPAATPVPSTGTYHRILDVAEALLAEHGVKGTSIRAITEQAHVNVAAVNYHFGTKEKLVYEVVKRRFESLEQERSEAIDEIEERCKLENRQAKPCELASVLISPAFKRIKSGDAGWINFIRFLARLNWEPGAEKFSPPPSSLGIFERFDDLLQKSVPELANDPGRRCWRLQFMRAASQQTMLVMAMLQSGQVPNAIAFAGALNSLGPDDIERELIKFVAAGLVS
ncbi:MAG: TetR/AcrR family transcriptional regulator [Micropepsaceae bacterium]